MPAALSAHTTLANSLFAGDPLATGSRHRAPWLARLWRLSPLTLLYDSTDGEAGQLLREGVLPLTARRGIDQALQGVPLKAPAVAAPSPQAAPERLPELVLCFDDWDSDAPLASLHAKLSAALPGWAADGGAPPQSLAETIRASQRTSRARVLLVLQHFEQLLLPSNACPAGRQAFCDALVELLADAELPVNVMVVVHERADALLGTLRRRVPRFDDHRLNLGAHKQPPHAQAPRGPANAGPDDDFRLSLDAVVLRAASMSAAHAADTPVPARAPKPPQAAPAAAAQFAQAEVAPAAAVPPPAPAPAVSVGPAAPEASLPEVPQAPALQASAQPSRNRLRMVAGSAAALVAAAAAWVTLGDRRAVAPDSPPLRVQAPATSAESAQAANAIAPAAPVAPTAPPTPSTPAVVAQAAPLSAPAPVVPAARRGAAPRLGVELAQALSASGVSVSIIESDASWARSLRSLGANSALAGVRYDALQAAAALRPSPRLQVLAPLFSEEMVFVVRADSRLQALHEMGLARISVGPAAGARAFSAQTAWRALFGRTLPAAQADASGEAEALQRLAAGKLDVVLLVGVQPLDGLDLPAGLRVLPLDRGHPSAQRAVRQFVPTTLAAGAAGGGLPQAPLPALSLMSFLVLPAAAEPATVARAAQALCAALPALRRDGHAKWQSVRPAAALPTAWPQAATAAELQACAPPQLDAANSLSPPPTRSNR